MDISLKVLSLTALGLSTPPSIGIGYINSQEKFYEQTKDKCLSKDIEAKSNGDWKKAQEKLTTSQQDELSQEFKDLKKLLESKSDDKKENGEYLKNLCVSTYDQVYSSWFFENKLLLKDLKNFCSLDIEEKLDKEKKFESTKGSDQDQIKQKLTDLQNHDENQHGVLYGKLKELKEKNKKDEEECTELRNWCQEIYKSPYLGQQSDNDFKLAQKYCQK